MGEYSFPKIFKGHFTCKSEKSNNFGQLKDNRKTSKADFTCGLQRPLAAEINKRPLLTSQKTPITSERYTVD
jgi:ABC-type thiamine transport system substrate-binding protein